MASFKGNGREDGSKRREGDPRRRRQGRPNLESLENRRLLAGGSSWHPTSSNPYDVQNGPLANLGKDLINVYHNYVSSTITPAQAAEFFISGSGGGSIGVDARGYGNFASFQQELSTIGMTVLATDATIDMAEGNIPISALPKLATISQIVGALPIYKPVSYQQGSSPNQSDLSLGGPTIRANYGVNGAGQTIGVISTSVNNYNGGLAASVKSGDLPSNVDVVQDAPPSVAADDEGRAMLEQIYDIDPGANLAFATGFTGELQFANNIQALYNVGARTIVDDLGYADEPYYQEGVITQGIDQVVSQGANYFSAAGNAGDSGYESQFRGVNATVPALGAGRYMNFNPNGTGVATSIGINVYTPSQIALQFDQPYYTANGVTSDVEIDVLDANGNLVAQANSNTTATQEPFQITPNTLPVGLYQVVIKVDANTPDPGHVVFYNFGDGGFSVDHQYGSAGGTYYPSTHGHNADANTISVGAVPFWGTAPYTSPTTVTSEPFSSTGPVLKEFAFNGTPITPTILQKPDISGTDGNNTSFFTAGQFINTTQVVFPANPPYPGNSPTTFTPPTTSTNQVVATLPTFFGTSSAAPNVAAISALIREVNPNITHSELLSDFETTATPLNGAAKGTYNAQGGFGLVNGIAAVQAAAVLQVAALGIVSGGTTSPGNGATIAGAPTSITVTFNKPVNIQTLTGATLSFKAPNGATVAVGNPSGVDSSTFPTVVSFPITITPKPGVIANGVYTVTVNSGTIRSEDGQTLGTPFSTTFNLQQTSGARITGTTLKGRVITITFSEPLNASTVNLNNIFLYRTNGNTASPLVNPQGIAVSQIAGSVYSYNPSNLTLTIDLSALPQADLPSDHYAIYASYQVLDAVGNYLNGQFNGVFPSGTNEVGGGTSFVQDLGFIQLSPPIIGSVTLTPASDSGIQGDLNTNVATPSFTGQVNAIFPTGLAGLTVYAEFNGISHTGLARGGLDLNVGANGRGFVGRYDVQATTNAQGQFTINYPAGVAALPEGENRLRIVVVGQPDSPPFAGLSSVLDTAFRVDKSLPYVGTTNGTQATSIPENANINSLTTLSLDVVDPVNPQTPGDPFAVDPKLAIPALNPVLADNTANYKLFRVVNGVNVDESSFITTATFTSTSNRVLTSDPLTGQVALTFGPGLPAGHYFLVALSSAFGTGLTDAAGNPFGGYQQNSQSGTPANFQLDFNLQPTPTYITAYAGYANAPTTGALQTTGPRATYEIPVAGVTARAPAPPTAFTIDFSNSLNPNVNYTNDVILARSADSAAALPDGNFGDLGITNSSGFTKVTGLTVTLENSVQGATFGQYGYDNRLAITVPAGSPLPADYYRIYLPNNGPTAIDDIYGNQLDGEFLGNTDATGKYVDLLPNGTTRGSGASEVPDLSGDGTPGGAFMTGFVVVPNGNVIFARADALYNPQIPSQVPNGSAARPYPVLAPEAVPNAINGGDLNSVVNSGANFNPIYDRSGLGTFEPSAFFAAQQLVLANGGPVVIEAEPSVPTTTYSPTGVATTVQRPFVLQAPAGSDPIANDASASIPALTTLVFQPGSALKMQNATLFVQNQGSALQVLGGPNANQIVNITSYKDSSVGGVTNGDPNSIPAAGDYGGIVFRDFSQAALPGSSTPRSTLFPGQIPTTGNPSVDDRLKSPLVNPATGGQADAVSGADDILSYVNFLVEKYAGGPVPQTNGIRYDGITIQGARPTITNSQIADAGGSGSAQAGLSVDVDALRQDDVASGVLLRGDSFVDNGLNGIYIRAEVASGIAEPTNAVYYPTNPSTAGGQANYVLNDPYPYLLTSRMVIGQRLLVETGGGQAGSTDRIYVDPGMVVKLEHGSAIQILGGSINVGDQTYIKEYDANHQVGPTYAATLPSGAPNPLAGQVNPNFVANSANLAKAIFTSLNDDQATSTYFDPITQTTTTIVAPLPAVPGGSGSLQPTPGNVQDAARWGGIELASGSVGVINGAIIRFGGGAINTATGTATINALLVDGSFSDGAHLSLTNSYFDDNSDVAVNLAANALLAGDPQRPLLSGNPFIHGNLFINNQYNGVGVIGGGSLVNPNNLNHNSVWTGSDFTYILRNTIILGGSAPAVPSSTQLLAIPKPSVTLTLQATPAGTILADGTTVAAPGVPLLIKELGQTIAPETPGVSPPANLVAGFQGGAGFIAGVDDGTDPPTPLESFVDGGSFNAIRIVGISANQSTGQTRVPVIITSLRDNTVGTTVNGVAMYNAFPANTLAPQPGDGGVIYFGGNSLTSYNLEDPRNGSIIDNADIRYITRVEQQGDGIQYGFDTTGAKALTPSLVTKAGLPAGNNVGFADQYNAPKALTISNSNLYDFSDAGVISHPGYGSLIIPVNYPVTAPFNPRTTAFYGEPTHLFLVNDTITGMNSGQATGVEVISETVDDTDFQSPAEAVFLNDTFNSDGVGINAVGMAADGMNFNSHVAFLAMDSIFSNIGATNAAGTFVPADAVTGSGQLYASDLQYDLFFNVAADANGNPIITGGIPDDQPVLGNPAYRAGTYYLTSTSAAIDRARSELGPSIFGDMLLPADTVDPNNLNAIPIRNVTGDTNLFGGQTQVFGNNFGVPQNAIVTLPGEPVTTRGFPDQWTAVLQSAAPGYTSSTNLGGTFAYIPLAGERDQLGNLRVKDPNSPNVGFGSQPFFDIGAFEYIIQNPPTVTAVTANVPSTTTPVNLYTPGGIAGTNQAITSINVQLNQQLDPNTINSGSVMLLASGGDGIFGNGNSPSDRSINLSGDLSFNATTDVLTINTTNIFSNAALLNDEYELVLKGTGSSVLKNRNGLALDGFTNGGTLPLPSGSDNFPGSDFVVNFTISTHSPSIVSGSFKLASDTSGGKNVTKTNTPTFTGTITDVFPPANPLLGDQVFVDISTLGNGVFDDIAAATGTTDVNGNFTVTVKNPLPNSPYVVGPTGMQMVPGDSGFTEARVRVVNSSGNASATLTTPLSTFQNTGAFAGFEVDTTAPTVTSITPTAASLANGSANGSIPVTITFSKNINPSTLNANTIQVFRAGGTGTFTGNGIQVPITASSISITYLHTAKGAISVSFSIPGPLPNDLYRIVLKGTGTAPITDIAGNPLAGSGTAGTDYVNGPFIVFSQANARLIYVSNVAGSITSPTATQGSRANPFTTIAAALATAQTGDDVLVLPGTYDENVTLKAQVRLLSADPSSTDTAYTPGSPTDTLIYGQRTGANTVNVVTGTNITPLSGLTTEVSGFSIISPLIGNPVVGPIDTTSSALYLLNASVLVDKDYIIDAGIGVNIGTNGTNAPVPSVIDNLIAGNISGIGISDNGGTVSQLAPVNVYNNTIVDNTYGLYNVSGLTNYTQAYVLNNIFYANHDLSTSRTGTGILSLSPNTLGVGVNLFYQNGANNTGAAQASGTFATLNPSALSAVTDGHGNFLANPLFISPRDPRPNGDTPAVFYNEGNYDLTTKSPAINAALESVAPATDILYRSPVAIPGHGSANTGPASIGAYYPLGTAGLPTTPGGGTTTSPVVTGGTTSGSISTGVIHALDINAVGAGPVVGGTLPIGTKQFDVVTTSLSSDGTATAAGQAGGTAYLPAPSSIVIDFSDDIDRTTLSAADLKLSGSGLSAANPAHVSGLTWVDNHTIDFLLAGSFNPTGTVNLSIPQGALKDNKGDALEAFADTFQLGNPPAQVSTGTPTVPAPVATVPTVPTAAVPVILPSTSVGLPLSTATVVSSLIRPVAVTGPIAVNYGTTASSKKKAKAKPAAKHAAPVKTTTAQHAAATAKHAATVAHQATPAKAAKATKAHKAK